MFFGERIRQRMLGSVLFGAKVEQLPKKRSRTLKRTSGQFFRLIFLQDNLDGGFDDGSLGTNAAIEGKFGWGLDGEAEIDVITGKVDGFGAVG